eukprot:765723-Amphidinium_carterae.1
MGHAISTDEINDWVTCKKRSSGLNAKQLEALDLVANRIMVEFRLAEASCEATRHPLVWLVHDPLGTGKSFVLSAIRGFLNDGIANDWLQAWGQL